MKSSGPTRHFAVLTRDADDQASGPPSGRQDLQPVSIMDVAAGLHGDCSGAGRLSAGTVKLFDVCFSTEIIRKFFNLSALDIHDAARPEDRSAWQTSVPHRDAVHATIDAKRSDPGGPA